METLRALDDLGVGAGWIASLIVGLHGIPEAALHLTGPLEAAAQSVSVALAEYSALPTRAKIARELERITGGRYSLRVEHDPDWGCVYEVAVGASAREALEANLKLQEKFPGIPIVVEWAGEKDVTDEELVDYLVKIAIKGGFRVEAPPGFDAVKAVRELREG